MAIVKNGERYYISYKLKLDNGEYITRNIKNKEWVSKRFVKSIELDEIEKDKKKYLDKKYVSSKMTFENVVEQYLSSISISSSKETVYTKRLKAYKYLVPLFPNHLMISEVVNVSSITEALNQLRINCTENAKTNSNELYIFVVRLLRSIIEYAMVHDFCSDKDQVKIMALLSNIKVKKSTDNQKLMFWTPEQFNKFIDTFNGCDEKWKYFFLTTYYCALRIGEVLALKWADFSYKHSKISVNKTLDRQSEIALTKTESSNAIVDMPNWLATDLNQFKIDLGATNNDYMFFKKNTCRTVARRMMEKHEKMANLPHIKFHCLRHSIASYLINSGENVLIVSKHLRHSNTEQTLNTYSHIFPKITNGIFDKLTTTPK